MTLLAACPRQTFWAGQRGIDWLRDGAHVPLTVAAVLVRGGDYALPLVLLGCPGVSRRTPDRHSLDLAGRTVIPPGGYEVYRRLGVVFDEVPV